MLIVLLTVMAANWFGFNLSTKEMTVHSKRERAKTYYKRQSGGCLVPLLIMLAFAIMLFS